MQVYRTRGLDHSAGEELRISGGNVTIEVDGDFVAQGSFNLIIEPGSTLTVVVSGKTQLGAAFKVTDGTANANNYSAPISTTGLPSFSIYSTYSGANGVQLDGNGKLTATIYAPNADVNLGGSGELFGSVRGRNVTTPGGTAIHFDEALADLDIGGGDGGTVTEPTLTVISRR